MDRSPGGLLPVGLFAIGAVAYSLFPVANPNPAAELDSVARSLLMQSQVATPPCITEDPLQILDDFLDAKSGKACISPVNQRASVSARPYHVTFLVATVPDPIDSHLVPTFDRAVDSIQRGMERGGYILDSLFFPWKKDTETRWHVAANPSGSEDLLTVSPKPAVGDLHRRIPGALLFRGTRAPEELLIVYLVGETPTFGIQRGAMSRALDAVATCRSRAPTAVARCEDEEIPILGPYFSGSSESLRNSLWAWNETWKKRFRIVSGSATVESNAQVLRSPYSTFAATVVSDETLRRTFYEFLNRRIEPLHKGAVALFVEAGTGYGSSFVFEKQASRTGPASSSGDSSREKPGVQDPVKFTIPFPLHISQLRAAYETDIALKNEGLFRRGPRHVLELPLEAPERNPKDILPPQDPRMTAAVADLVLSAGIETIRREKIHFVGIVASDARDILFLARKIRDSETNVTLFTFGADILYTHPDYDRYLRGMLVATPYPLFWSNQQWTGAGLTGAGQTGAGTRISFSGSSEEGIYNAVQALVRDDKGEQSPLLEYRPPLKTGTSANSGKQRPSIWVVAVGRHGFWPVWFTSDYEDKSAYVFSPDLLTLPIAPGPAREESPPGVWLAFFLIQAVFLLILPPYFGKWLRWPRGNQRLSDLTQIVARCLRGISHRVEILFATWSDSTARDIHRAYMATLFFLFAIIEATLGAYLFAARRFLFGSALGFGLMLGAVLALLLALLVPAAREFLSLRRRGRGKPRRWLMLLGGLLIGLPLARYLAEIVGMTPNEGLAFYARSLDLTSTVTPILSFLLGIAILCLWAATNIQRGFLLEAQGAVRQPGEWRIHSLEGMRSLQSSIRQLLDDPATRAVALLGPLLSLLPFYRVLHPNEYHTMDGSGWSLIFQVILLLCYFTIVYSFTLFVLLWLRMSRLLKRLSSHPLAEAFPRLPESVSATPWKMWRSVPSLSVLSASVWQLRALVNLGRGEGHETTEKTLSEQAELADKQLQKAFRNGAESLTKSLPFQRSLHKILAAATVTILGVLEVEWTKWPGPAGSLEDLRKTAREEPVLSTPAWIRRGVPSGDAIWLRTAEEFVALRMSVFIRYVFLQMKNLLSFVFVGFLLVLAAINAYPFEPKRLVMALIWVLALLFIAIIAWVFVGMDRDPVLSFIGKTRPGHATFSFELIGSMMIYVVVPLLTLLATQFPGVGDVIFSIFNPAVKSLSK